MGGMEPQRNPSEVVCWIWIWIKVSLVRSFRERVYTPMVTSATNMRNTAPPFIDHLQEIL